MNTALRDVKILLVEDEALIAMDFQDEIENAGGSVIEICRSRKAAILIAADGVFDAAVLDLNLRDGNTIEVAEILQGRGIPFLFATGDAERFASGRWSDIPVLKKPSSAETLVKLLHNLLENYSNLK